MIEILMNEIEQAMIPALNNEQLSQLRKVMEFTFRNICVTEKEQTEQQVDDRIVEKFLAAKRVEGCSDKSIHYYHSTLNNALRKVGKDVKHITTDDLRAAGGNETEIPKKFDDVLYPLGFQVFHMYHLN